MKKKSVTCQINARYPCLQQTVAPRRLDTDNSRYPAEKMSSTKYLVFYNFQGASKLFKDFQNNIQVSNSMYSDETPSYSASHQNPSCKHMELWLRSAG